jgi:hypothetical protein
MEKEIINIMSSRNLNKIHLEYLIDLGDEIDADGEAFAITCNTLKIVNGEVIVYNDNNEDWDGSVDEEDKYFINDLDEDQQKQALWCLDATLEYLDKNNIK